MVWPECGCGLKEVSLGDSGCGQRERGCYEKSGLAMASVTRLEDMPIVYHGFYNAFGIFSTKIKMPSQQKVFLK